MAAAHTTYVLCTSLRVSYFQSSPHVAPCRRHPNKTEARNTIPRYYSQITSILFFFAFCHDADAFG